MLEAVATTTYMQNHASVSEISKCALGALLATFDKICLAITVHELFTCLALCERLTVQRTGFTQRH